MISDLREWTAVALSHDLPKGGVLRTVVDDQDLAIWRGRSGMVNAWDNRCPHRGMRLSFGFVRGDSLTCIYHGWQYGADAVCHYIPAHPDLTPPKTLCAKAFSCTERDHLIWVSLADLDSEPDLGLSGTTPIRSLVFEQGFSEIRRLAETLRFPIHDAWQPGQGNFGTIASTDRCVIREGEDHGERRILVMVLQALADDRTAIHVLTSPEATPSMRTTLSRWLERFRWFVENPDMPPSSWQPVEQRA